MNVQNELVVIEPEIDDGSKRLVPTVVSPTVTHDPRREDRLGK